MTSTNQPLLEADEDNPIRPSVSKENTQDEKSKELLGFFDDEDG